MSASDGYCRECGLDLDADPGGDHDEGHRLCWECWHEKKSEPPVTPEEAAAWWVRERGVTDLDQLQAFLREDFTYIGEPLPTDGYRAVAEQALRAPNGNRRDRRGGDRCVAVESFATVQAETQRWFWDGRIPLQAPTLEVGREGTGKSTLNIALAARASRGELEGEFYGTPVNVLMVSYEDSARSTIKPRLLAADADVERVYQLVAEYDGARDLVTLPDDLDQIAQRAQEIEARLIVVDPFSASLNSDVNSHRDQDVRRALAPLARLADDGDLAVLLVAHFNKAAGGDALSRVLGSRGITAAVRSVLAFGRTPDAPEDSLERVLAHAKCNVGRRMPSLACRIEACEVEVEGHTISTSRLVIGEEIEVVADALLATRSDDERTDREIAVEWLGEEIGDGEWHPAREIREAAKRAGHADRTLDRAAVSLGVERQDAPTFPRRVEWRLPVAPPPVAPPSNGEAGATGKPRIAEPNPGDEQPLLRQASVGGATGENRTQLAGQMDLSECIEIASNGTDGKPAGPTPGNAIYGPG